MGQSMTDQRTLLVCSCDNTIPLDGNALARGCAGVKIIGGRQLCRAELDRFRALVASDSQITVACTQEAPLFREVAAEDGVELNFVNLRESAGWSSEAEKAGPKMAALAAAAMAPPEVSYVQLESSGIKGARINRPLIHKTETEPQSAGRRSCSLSRLSRSSLSRVIRSALRSSSAAPDCDVACLCFGAGSR